MFFPGKVKYFFVFFALLLPSHPAFSGGHDSTLIRGNGTVYEGGSIKAVTVEMPAAADNEDCYNAAKNKAEELEKRGFRILELVTNSCNKLPDEGGISAVKVIFD